MSDNLFRS